jgi:uncharacterized protein YaiL (DUF2058 family)
MMGCSLKKSEEFAKEREKKKARAKELIEENSALIDKAKSAPLFAKAPTIERLADNQQELSLILLDLII